MIMSFSRCFTKCVRHVSVIVTQSHRARLASTGLAIPWPRSQMISDQTNIKNILHCKIQPFLTASERSNILYSSSATTGIKVNVLSSNLSFYNVLYLQYLISYAVFDMCVSLLPFTECLLCFMFKMPCYAQ